MCRAGGGLAGKDRRLGGDKPPPPTPLRLEGSRPTSDGGTAPPASRENASVLLELPEGLLQSLPLEGRGTDVDGPRSGVFD
jgi:hypothetical protein